MPATKKEGSIPTQRAADKEAKRARGASYSPQQRNHILTLRYRRAVLLKLRCDKTVPCSSCKRRGCSAICPNGSLITGQGTRFVLADTEKLHQKIETMSDRIRDLENALSILQATVAPKESHPLLDRELLKIKSIIELHAAVQDGDTSLPLPEAIQEPEEQAIDSFGTLAIHDDGAATFYGPSAGSEGEASTTGFNQDMRVSPPRWDNSAVAQIASVFPFTNSIDTSYDELVEHYLPEWDVAAHLCSLYLETAPWFFGAVTSKQLHEELLPMWYEDNAKRAVVQSPESTNGGKGSPHELAIFFMVLCFGALTDMNLPPAPDNPVCDKYYDATKAALALESILERAPSVATVQTIALMGIYEGLKGSENSIEATWTLMGLASKDCARWQLSPAEVQKRRALFWELFITDGWQSLATGRLATFSLPFVDCELPLDPDQTMADNGTIHPSFPFWKARFGAECVAAVVQGTLTSRAPRYSIILELDRKIRDMELPKYAQEPPPEGAGLSQTMSHYMPHNYRELTLLYVHRCFFVHAITSNPLDPIKSQYAPSFLAGYRSACDLLASVGKQFSKFPSQIARFWVLWTHAFSSAVMISSVVTHGAQCKVAPAALLQLEVACKLFEAAAAYGGRAVKFLPIVRRLQEKAQAAFLDARNGIPRALANDIFRPSTVKNEDDEMAIFGGKTHVLTTSRSRANLRSPAPSPSQSGTSTGSAGLSTASAAMPTDNPSFTGVHPSLVSELNTFDMHIQSQLQNAYHSGNSFAHALLGRQPEASSRTVSDERRLLREGQERDARIAEQHRIEEQRRMEATRAQQQQHAYVQYQQQYTPSEQPYIDNYSRAAPPPMHSLQQTPSAAMPQSSGGAYDTHSYEQGRDDHSRPSTASYSSGSREYGVAGPSRDYPSRVPSRDYTSSVPSRDYSRGSGSSSELSSNAASREYMHASPVSSSSGFYWQDQVMGEPTAPPQHLQAYSRHPQPQAQHLPPARDSSLQAAHSSHHVASAQYSAPQQAPQHAQQQPYFTHPPPAPTFQHYTPDGAMQGVAADDQQLQQTWQNYMRNVGPSLLWFGRP
ncbi:hypothetical protein CYLTODRAFT_421875, partial [Cylindrobasidium torrendii FP15055 ss-10]